MEDQGVIFDGDTPTTRTPYDDPEIELVDGIFGLHDSDVNDGVFEELEYALVTKGIPFDRETGMDWEIEAQKRIYRPGTPPFNHIYYLNGDGEMVVPVAAVRDRLNTEGRNPFTYDPLKEIQKFLDEACPAYPPLERAKSQTWFRVRESFIKAAGQHGVTWSDEEVDKMADDLCAAIDRGQVAPPEAAHGREANPCDAGEAGAR